MNLQVPLLQVNSSSPLSDPDLFYIDDLEFRTITSLLHALGSHDKIPHGRLLVSRSQRPYLKLLAALSSLLVRDHEIIAILPKRSPRGVTLFVGSEEAVVDTGYDSSSSSSSTSSPPCFHHLVTRNPRKFDPQQVVVQLLPDTVVEVGPDVSAFILENWDQSFQHHVQAFADLLNKSLNTPTATATKNIKMYSVFQSAPKVYRRMLNSALIRELPIVDVGLLSNSLCLLPPVERRKVFVILYDDDEGKTLHPKLYSLVQWQSAHTDQPSPLTMADFHEFFLWFLTKVVREFEYLRHLRVKKQVPDSLPNFAISDSFAHLEILRYFAWDSGFFLDYMQVASRIIDPAPAQMVSDGENSDDGENNDNEGDHEPDFSTEFDASEEQAAEPNHQWILDLRLISSNIQHLAYILSRPPMRFSFQVIQYPASDTQLKPWPTVVREMFPDPDVERRVLEAISASSSTRLRRFTTAGPGLQFKGQAHCEAVLACLYNLTGSGETSWVLTTEPSASRRYVNLEQANISPALLKALRNSSNLLAPSKRCCPICATTITLLSAAGGPRLQALSSHSIIFPCAFPPGLARNVRLQLLHTYRSQLMIRLLALTEEVRPSSSHSQQSQPLSLTGDGGAQQEIRVDVDAIMARWEFLDDEVLKNAWARAQKELTREMLDACWSNMHDRGKAILTAP